jgi:hypothetical protein
MGDAIRTRPPATWACVRSARNWPASSGPQAAGRARIRPADAASGLPWSRPHGLIWRCHEGSVP